MLFADNINTSSMKSFNLATIGNLQRRKNSNVTGLELVGGMRRETAQKDIVCKAKL